MSFARFNEFATTNNGVEGDEEKSIRQRQRLYAAVNAILNRAAVHLQLTVNNSQTAIYPFRTAKCLKTALNTDIANSAS
jgi:hypothetical protein